MTPHEREKVQTALHLIQEAQSLINQAASELCSVNGFANEWSASGKVYERIKRYWHVVNSRRSWLLDRAARKAVTS